MKIFPLMHIKPKIIKNPLTCNFLTAFFVKLKKNTILS